jgi:hypothetical protein
MKSSASSSGTRGWHDFTVWECTMTHDGDARRSGMSPQRSYLPPFSHVRGQDRQKLRSVRDLLSEFFPFGGSHGCDPRMRMRSADKVLLSIQADELCHFLRRRFFVFFGEALRTAAAFNGKVVEFGASLELLSQPDGLRSSTHPGVTSLSRYLMGTFRQP